MLDTRNSPFAANYVVTSVRENFGNIIIDFEELSNFPDSFTLFTLRHIYFGVETQSYNRSLGEDHHALSFGLTPNLAPR